MGGDISISTKVTFLFRDNTIKINCQDNSDGDIPVTMEVSTPGSTQDTFIISHAGDPLLADSVLHIHGVQVESYIVTSSAVGYYSESTNLPGALSYSVNNSHIGFNYETAAQGEWYWNTAPVNSFITNISALNSTNAQSLLQQFSPLIATTGTLSFNYGTNIYTCPNVSIAAQVKSSIWVEEHWALISNVPNGVINPYVITNVSNNTSLADIVCQNANGSTVEFEASVPEILEPKNEDNTIQIQMVN